jgi:general secretion pathway protein C
MDKQESLLMAFAHFFYPAQVVQALALLATLAGVVTWTPLLLTSAESQSTAIAPQVQRARNDNPALQWFSNVSTPLDVKVDGVLVSARGAVAILSLNGDPPRSFLPGELLSPAVRLAAVDGSGVVIERGSEKVRVNLVKLSDGPALPMFTR